MTVLKFFFFFCRDKKTFMTLSYSLAVKLPLPFEQQTYSTTENHAAALSLLKMADSGGMFFFLFFLFFFLPFKAHVEERVIRIK